MRSERDQTGKETTDRFRPTHETIEPGGLYDHPRLGLVAVTSEPDMWMGRWCVWIKPTSPWERDLDFIVPISNLRGPVRFVVGEEPANAK